jgi:hypothetical protein
VLLARYTNARDLDICGQRLTHGRLQGRNPPLRVLFACAVGALYELMFGLSGTQDLLRARVDHEHLRRLCPAVNPQQRTPCHDQRALTGSACATRSAAQMR